VEHIVGISGAEAFNEVEVLIIERDISLVAQLWLHRAATEARCAAKALCSDEMCLVLL
jgi:hypothetical protein